MRKASSRDAEITKPAKEQSQGMLQSSVHGSLNSKLEGLKFKSKCL